MLIVGNWIACIRSAERGFVQVSYDQQQMQELRAFHEALIAGPIKKKDAKNVAEELKKLTEQARRALGRRPTFGLKAPVKKPCLIGPA